MTESISEPRVSPESPAPCTRDEPHAECVAINHYVGGPWKCQAVADPTRGAASPPTPRLEAAIHEPHWGEHNDYACRFSGPHCWECGEPWPCRASRGVESEARGAAPLDVPMLAEALTNEDGPASAWCRNDLSSREFAERVAEEYLRLSEGPIPPCVYCGGRRWTEDENWQPHDPATWKGERSHGNGLIPCGGCNEGGWTTPDWSEEPIPPQEPKE